MKQGWEIKKLGDVCIISAGQGAPQGESNYCTNGIPFVKAGNLEDLINGLPESTIQNVSDEVAKKHRLKLYKAGSVVFAKSGMSCMKGYVYALKNDCYVVSHLAILTPHSIDTFFLKYLLEFYRPNTLVKDSAYPSISLEDIKSFSVPVPSLPEQEKIVAELDCLSGIIEKKKQQLKEYDALAQSIFYEMFGNPIDNEKGWEIKRLGDVASDIFAGGDKPKDISPIQTEEYAYPVYANGDGGRGLLGYAKKYRVESKAVTIGARGASVGNCRICDEKFTPVVRLITIIPNANMDILFLYHCLLHTEWDVNGAGQAQLTTPNVISKTIFLPPLALQQEFASKIEATEKQKELIKQSIAETETLFNSRMDYYFN